MNRVDLAAQVQKRKCLVELEQPLQVWHWSDALSIQRHQGAIERGEAFTHLRAGVIGPGLYVSLSAIDTLEEGKQNPLVAEIKQGTRTMVIDPWLFSVGVAELFEEQLSHDLGIQISFPPPPKDIRSWNMDPKTMVPMLMDELDVPCALYGFGFFPSVMVRHSRCLVLNKVDKPADLVRAYCRKHPLASPFNGGKKLLEHWLSS